MRATRAIWGFSVLALAMAISPVSGQEAEAEGGWAAMPSLGMHFLASNGLLFGVAFLIMAFVLAGLFLSLAWRLRRRKAFTSHQLGRLTEAAATGSVDRMSELVRDDASYLGQALRAGLARMPYGLEEARRGMSGPMDLMRSARERSLRWLAGIAVLGPLMGVLGTMLGAILIFMAMGTRDAVNPAYFAQGMSHALVVTFEGVFLAILAVLGHVVFKNRLSRLLVLTSTTADDLLTRVHFR